MSAERRKILWIKIDPLHPLDSGGKIRSFNMLKEWHQTHDITYLSLADANIPLSCREQASEYSGSQFWVDRTDSKPNPILFALDLVQNFLFSSLPYIVYKYRSKAFQQLIRETLTNNDYDIVIVDFLQVSSNFLDVGIDLDKAILFEHNVESVIWKRHAEQARNPLLRWYFRSQWKRCHDFEIHACSRLAGVVAVSEDDADYFRQEMGLTNILGYVPTGVDIDFFAGDDTPKDPHNIVFLGSMDWMPNIEGVIQFVNEVLPLVREQIPDVTLSVVGRNPADRVKKLAAEPGVEITGTVDDVRPYLHRAALSVVPLSTGSGTRIKIYELMAARVPVVSTTIGAEGLPLQHDHDILLADEPQAFANEVLRLMQDTELQDKISNNAFDLVANNFTWSQVMDKFERLCLGQGSKDSNREINEDED